MRVGVDEAGKDRGVAVVTSIDVGAGRGLHLGGTAERYNAIAVDEDRRPLDGGGAAAVEQTRRRDQREAWRDRRARERVVTQSTIAWYTRSRMSVQNFARVVPDPLCIMRTTDICSLGSTQNCVPQAPTHP